MTQNQVDPRAAARFDFLLRFHAKEAGIAWLSSLTTWGWQQGAGLAIAMAPGCSDNVAMADDVLEAAERLGVVRKGNLQPTATQAAFYNYRQGGYFTGGEVGKSHSIRRAPKKMGHLVRPTDHAWQLTELGEAYFKWLMASSK